ncbi:hypothetical protein HZS_5493 [Henneguya salminicola]|nr:hypothetical protein HZS_5493 [Henneguya salminicola]
MMNYENKTKDSFHNFEIISKIIQRINKLYKHEMHWMLSYEIKIFRRDYSGQKIKFLKLGIMSLINWNFIYETANKISFIITFKSFLHNAYIAVVSKFLKK